MEQFWEALRLCVAERVAEVPPFISLSPWKLLVIALAQPLGQGSLGRATIPSFLRCHFSIIYLLNGETPKVF